MLNRCQEINFFIDRLVSLQRMNPRGSSIFIQLMDHPLLFSGFGSVIKFTSAVLRWYEYSSQKLQKS